MRHQNRNRNKQLKWKQKNDLVLGTYNVRTMNTVGVLRDLGNVLETYGITDQNKID